MYIDSYEQDPAKQKMDAQVFWRETEKKSKKKKINLSIFLQDLLKPLIDVALELSKLKEFTGRDRPTVIT